MRWFSFSLVFVAFLCVSAVDWDVITPLDQYVHFDDGHYDWHEVASYKYNGVTVYIVNMTSQLYQTEAYSTRPIWWHYMAIAIPDTIALNDAGVLLIFGSDNEQYDPPDSQSLWCWLPALAANDSGVVTGLIMQMPNQPIYFHNDPNFERRSEDDIIAWTWRTFLDSEEPSDQTVLARMPMTKAAKRGLDTITAVAKIRAPQTNIQRFGVAGPSKRGWTTWSLAATDRRVVAAVPIVFSLLNLEGGTLLQHNQNMDGGWSFAFNPYWRANLTLDYFNPKVARIAEVEDMYLFKERFTIPILALVSSGDEFFLLDDNHKWWNDIPGPKWLMFLPNAEHIMFPHYAQVYETAISWFYSVFFEVPLPEVTWEMAETENGGYIHLHANPPPHTMRAWRAETLANDTRRDFRLLSQEPGQSPALHPVRWRQELQVMDMGNGEYHVEAEQVDGEWVGFFLEGEWEGPTGKRMFFTSQVNIIPYTYPRDQCTTAETCYGFLT